MTTTPKRISDLYEGDCFFYATPEQHAAMSARLATLDEIREYVGETVGSEAYANHVSACHGYIVVAIVRRTGERCVHRLSDNTYWIWYDGAQYVHYSANKAVFQLQLENIRKERRQLDEETARLNKAKSKKQRQADAQQGIAA